MTICVKCASHEAIENEKWCKYCKIMLMLIAMSVDLPEENPKL
jgi:hypothetical protein